MTEEVICVYIITMYVDDHRYGKNKRYRRVLLRENHWDKELKKNVITTILNLSNRPDNEIEAIKFAMNNKNNPALLAQIAGARIISGKSVGAVSVLYQVATRLGITQSLGRSESGRRILWLAMARLLRYGSRMAAKRATDIHAACEILNMQKFSEDTLYRDLEWVEKNQARIEKSLFKHIRKDKEKGDKREGTINNQNFYLYDLTSSYFEGSENDLAAFGYNRDKKKGKMQLTYGLLCDSDGEPVSVQAFAGNTRDNATVKAQLDKLKDNFGCKYVTLVGDKGMIKTGQMQEANEMGMHYLTTITKAQIRTLLKKGTIQMELFENDLAEVVDADDNVRYLMRRNPVLAKNKAETRESKLDVIQKKADEKNNYLAEHKKASEVVAVRHINEWIQKLKMEKWLRAEAKERKIILIKDEKILAEIAELDGCYVMKTDLPTESADKNELNDMYKGLEHVEWAFRSENSRLDVRPTFLRKEERTRGHLFVTLLSYKMYRYLEQAWKNLNFSVREGLSLLSTISANTITLNKAIINFVPEPGPEAQILLNTAQCVIPTALPGSKGNTLTKKT